MKIRGAFSNLSIDIDNVGAAIGWQKWLMAASELASMPRVTTTRLLANTAATAALATPKRPRRLADLQQRYLAFQ